MCDAHDTVIVHIRVNAIDSELREEIIMANEYSFRNDPSEIREEARMIAKEIYRLVSSIEPP